MRTGEEISGAVKHMKKSGALWVVICAFAVGIIALIIGSCLGNEEKKGSERVAEGSKEGFEEYKRGLEEGIMRACEKVTGVGDVFVILDFKSSGETIYATNSNTSSDGGKREEYVIVGSGSNAEALYLGEKLPQLSGIGIVCYGGSISAGQKNEIASLLSSAYGLPLTRIYVI